MINEGQEQITELLNSQDKEDCLLGIILAMKTQSWAWLRWNLHNKYFPLLLSEKMGTPHYCQDDDMYIYLKGDIVCNLIYGTVIIHKRGEHVIGSINVTGLPEDHIIELE